MENIEEIKTPRINGYLNLDIYFLRRLGRPIEDQEDLFINGLIDMEATGRSDKFWILDEQGNRIALFKEPINYQGDETYAELISEEVSKILGIPTAHYDLAIFNGRKGVVSYNFIKEHDSYESGFDILMDFYERKLESNKINSDLYGIDYKNDTIDDVSIKLNNLEDAWCILEEKYKDHPNKEHIVYTLVNGLVDKLIFDILMVNVDDHCDNWGELDTLEDGRILAPQFDNARVLNLHNNIAVEQFISSETIEDKDLSFVVDNTGVTKPLDVLKYFLNISSSEYTDLVRNKVNDLKGHIDDVPAIIEERTEATMPHQLKKYFITTMNEHLEKVSEIVDSKIKGKK